MYKVLCGQMFEVLLGTYLLELLGHMLTHDFWGDVVLISKATASFYISNSEAQGFNFSTSLPTQVIFFSLFNDSHHRGYAVVSHYGFDLHLFND